MKDNNTSKDDSGFTRNDKDSYIQSDPRENNNVNINNNQNKKYELPNRSAVLDDVNKNKDNSYILKMNKQNDDSIGNMNMSNT